MHAHDVSSCAVCMCALRMRVGHGAQERLRLNRTWSEHNLYLACEDSPQRAFFFCTFSCSRLALLAPTVPWLLFLNAPNRQLRSVLDSANAYVAEDQPLCPTRPPLSRSAVLPCPPSLVARLGIRHSSVLCQCTWRKFRGMRNLTFLSVTHTYIARIDPSFKASR